MRSNPYFFAAASVVSPAEMSRKVKDVDTGEKEPLPPKADAWKWEDFGLCRKRDEVVWRGDHCADWKSSMSRALREALFGDEADFV